MKASRQTLKRHTRKRLPKRIEDLEETTTSNNFFTRTLRKRKQPSPSSSTTSLNSKKFRSSTRYLSRLSPSPPKDSLYPLRKQEALKAHKSMTSSPSCFSTKKKSKFDWSKVSLLEKYFRVFHLWFFKGRREEREQEQSFIWAVCWRQGEGGWRAAGRWEGRRHVVQTLHWFSEKRGQLYSIFL